jgi:hypothetical protein
LYGTAEKNIGGQEGPGCRDSYHALSRRLEEETGEHRQAFEKRMKKEEQGGRDI